MPSKDEKLTNQEKKFVKEIIETGNRTQAVVNAYNEKNEVYAGVKGHRLIRKDKIQKAIRSIADSLPDKLLKKVHLEGLEAGRRVFKNNNETGEIEDLGVEADYAVRHKYLDTAYKLKGVYAPEKGINLNLNLDDGLTDEEKDNIRKLFKK